MSDIYGGRDPRDVPAYTVREAAHHLRLPQSTLRLWTAGSRGRSRRSVPLFAAAQRRPWILSFWNLLEAQVLATIRRRHAVSMQRVRKALNAVEKGLGTKRPFITVDFATDGVDLFIERYGTIARVSAGELEELDRDLRASLERVERDEEGLAAKFYPWAKTPYEARVVQIDPRISFGRPVVAETAVPAAVLAERWESGDSLAKLAREYGVARARIEDAIRWQVGQAA